MLLCAVVTGGSATVYRADHDFDQIGGLIYRSVGSGLVLDIALEPL